MGRASTGVSNKPEDGGGEKEGSSTDSAAAQTNLKLNAVTVQTVSISSDGQFRVSRVVELIIDGHRRTTISQSRKGYSLTWRINPGVAISPTSSIVVQPYHGRKFTSPFVRRKKAEAVDIPGRNIFDALQKASENDFTFSRQCSGFRIALRLSLNRDTEVTKPISEELGKVPDLIPSNSLPAGNDDPRSEALPENSFTEAFYILEGLLTKFPPGSSTLQWAENAKSAMRDTSTILSVDDRFRDFLDFGSSVRDLVSYLATLELSAKLITESNTVEAVMQTIVNSANYIQDACQQPDVRPAGLSPSDTVSPGGTREIMLNRFVTRLTRLKRNINERKHDVFEPIYMPKIESVNADEAASAAIERDDVSDELSTAEEEGWLEEMLHPKRADRDARNPFCLPTTRQVVLATIRSWLDSDDEPNVLLLSGSPGTGKTAISSVILAELESRQRLAGTIILRHYKYHPDDVWPTIGYYLACYDPLLSTAITDVVKEDCGAIIELVDQTFKKYVKTPLDLHAEHLSTRRPVVVLDGLDSIRPGIHENDEYIVAWKTLIQTILQWTEFSPSTKLLVTTRPNADISAILDKQKISRIDLPSGSDAIGTEAEADIKTYITHRLAAVFKENKALQSSPQPWPRDDHVAKMATHAAGMFAWAKAAIDLISKGPDPDRLLTSVVATGTAMKFDAVDARYNDILQENFGNSLPPGFHIIVGAIAIAKFPLTLSDLRTLFTKDLEGTSLEAICTKLAPVISLTGDERYLRIRHRSFSDYLMDPKRCTGPLEPFLIDPSGSARKMVYACLRVMLDELRFNICELKSSHVSSVDLPDLDDKVRKHIPSHLSYACQFWAEHLRDLNRSSSTDENNILLLVQRVLRSRLLYWFEVLSFLAAFDKAPGLLFMAAEWLEGFDKESALLAVDASKFAQAYRDPIVTSASHIYVTALPFCPPESMVSQLYKSQFPRLLDVRNAPKYLWASTRFVVKEASAVLCISASADGKRIAIGLNEGQIQIRSTKTSALLSTLEGHTRSVISLAFSPNGKRLVSGSEDDTLRIWEFEPGLVSSTVLTGHADWVRSVAISPDGTKIASGSDDKTVRMWSLERGTQLLDPMHGHTDWVRSVAFFPDGTRLVSSGDDSVIRIWDVATGECTMQCHSGHTIYVMSIAVSPDGKMLATGSSDGTIRRWAMTALSEIGVPLQGHSSTVNSVSFSPDNQLLASGGVDGTVQLWDAATGYKFCGPLLGHFISANCVLFSHDGKTIYSGSADYTVRFWDRDHLPMWSGSSAVPDGFLSVDVSPDGDTVVGMDNERIWNWDTKGAGISTVPLAKPHSHIRCAAIRAVAHVAASASDDNTIRVWDLRTGAVVHGLLVGHSSHVNAIAVSSDGKRIVSGSNDGTVRIWDATTGDSLCGPLEGHGSRVTAVAVSLDGVQLASGDSNGFIRIWTMADGRLVGEPLHGEDSRVNALAFSPDSKFIAAGLDDSTVAIWNVETGTLKHKDLHGHSEVVICVTFSADGMRIASGGNDNAVCVWDTETGRILCGPLKGHSAMVRSVVFSNGGNRVVSCSAEGIIRAWDVRLKKHRVGYLEGHGDWVHCVAFSSDGTCVASGSDDTTVRVRDAVTGQEAYPPLEGHEDWVRSLSFSRDGTHLVTASDDKTLRMWDARTGEALSGAITGHSGFVRSVAFSPDGAHVVSGSDDRTVRIWTFSYGADGKLGQSHSTVAFTHEAGVNCVIYAPDGRYIASGADDGMVHLAGTVAPSDGLTFKAHDVAVHSLAFSSDSQRLYTSSEDKSIRMWDARTGTALLSPMLMHTGPVYSIALSPGGETLVSGSRDATVRLWNAHTGALIAMPLRGHSDVVFAVAASPDGARIASSSADKAVALWDLALCREQAWPDSFRRRARDIAFCASDRAGFYSASAIRDNGWVCGPRGELLFWVPPMYRAGLWMPRTTGLLGAAEIILDMEAFVHGTEWEMCREAAA